VLSTTSEYAVRALIHLARLEEGGTLLGRDLALTSDIPNNYLAKILLALNKVGIVEASRGPGGGYRLKRPADTITLLEVARVFEGEAAVPSCFLQHSHLCTDGQPCSAHHAWKRVKNTYTAFLTRTTIGGIAAQVAPDLQTPQEELR